MADEATKPTLTLDDPVDPDTLKELANLHENRSRIANHLVDLENEKVRLLVLVRQLDAQRTKVFDRIISERGLPEGYAMSIDAETGKLSPNGPPPETPAAPK